MITRCSLFHTDRWRSLMRSCLNYRPKDLTVKDNGKNITLRCWERDLFIFRLIGSPLRGGFIPCGEIESSLSSGSLNKLLLKLFWRSRGGFAEITFAESVPHTLPPLLRLIFKKIEKYTFLIDLKPSIEQILANMSQRARNMIRKAEKNNVSISKIHQPTERDLLVFYSMLENTFAKSRSRPPHRMSFYRAILESDVPYLFLCARQGSEIYGFSLFLYDKTEAFYIAGTSTIQGNKLAVSSLLQWSAIQEFKRYGLKVYDLGGGGIPSIDKFKQSFGGRTVFRSSFFSRLSFGYLLMRVKELL